MTGRGQVSRRLGYLGPAGSNTEMAALKHDGGAVLLPFATNRSVADAVSAGSVDAGGVPIENSLQGSVTDTVDMLIHDSPLLIRHEIVLPIEHLLLVRAGTAIGDVEVVFSHPQALAQCRSFLAKRLPGAELVASLSTSASVEDMKRSERPAASIATSRAADLYGAEVAARDIQDNPKNTTRFVVLATGDHPATGADKTSLCFNFDENVPGQLFSVLEVLAQRRINMTKIESRPRRQSLGQYIFLVDVEGHREESTLMEALGTIGRQVSMLKILGSYPMDAG